MNTQNADWMRELNDASVDQTVIDGIVATITCICEERARAGEVFCDISLLDPNRFMLINGEYHRENLKNSAVFDTLQSMGFEITEANPTTARIAW